MAKSNFGRSVNGGKQKQTRVTVPAAGAGQPESQTLQPIDANQEVNVLSKKGQQLSVRQLWQKVRYTLNLLETGRNQIAVLTDANADLLERVQHLEKENSDLRVKIEKAESLLVRLQHLEKDNSDLRNKIEKAESDKKVSGGSACW